MKFADIEVVYKDHMGSDLSVVNAARVSFHKESLSLNVRDIRLIQYLAKHNHWTPFGHTAVQLRIKAPFSVARQLAKHQVGGVWNEVSRRYVTDDPEFYMPVFRHAADNVKQGSGVDMDPLDQQRWQDRIRTRNYHGLEAYRDALSGGVAPEQARFFLPENTMTEWYWTGSIAFFARVCKLRLDPHSQKETRDVAEKISGICRHLFPHSWDALVPAENTAVGG